MFNHLNKLGQTLVLAAAGLLLLLGGFVLGHVTDEGTPEACHAFAASSDRLLTLENQVLEYTINSLDAIGAGNYQLSAEYSSKIEGLTPQIKAEAQTYKTTKKDCEG